MAFIKVLAKELAFLAAFYAGVRYLGEFTLRESIALTFIAWVGYELYAKLNASRRVEKVFEPFCVSVHPNWYELLSDFQLIVGMEAWHRLREEAERVPASEYNVFRSGFLYTVIQPPSDQGLLPGLTYWNNQKMFLSEVELSGSIVEIKDESILPRLREEHPFLKHPRWAQLPEVYFKWGAGGYELGLEVQLEWWENLCKSGGIGELANAKTHKDHLCGTTRLVIATLPYSEFGIYYDVSVDRMKEWEKVMDKQLEACEWKRTVERDSEIRDPWSRVEHKYFAVAHRGV
jgi:hypothetical protein